MSKESHGIRIAPVATESDRIVFDAPASPAFGRRNVGLLLILMVLAALFLANYSLVFNGLFRFVKAPDVPLWKTCATALMLINLLVLVWRFVLVMRYRPAAACTDAELKSCTVIIPAYNEGSQVLATIRSVMASDYPAEKLQVICVDDGSKDDTWQWMCRGREEFGERVETIRSPRNQGKRHALNHGFLRATGDVLVTIDSDSEVETSTLRNIVSVFCRNERVGAVAGNVRVLNVHEGFIPRMLDVAFAFSFDFIRAAQSGFNTVMCTPGALSAYDRGVVSRVRRKWLRQTFMGLPANIGEDRAMTNLILREGRLVHFQSNAVVYTNVPVGYRGLCKMYLRWARSNVRETIAFTRFGFTKFRPESVLGAQVDLALQWLRMILGEVFKFVFLASLFTWPLATGLSFGVGTAIAAALPALFYLQKHRSMACFWAFPYALYSFVALSWISLYALLTPQKNGWLTRDLGAAKPEAVVPVAQSMAQSVAQSMTQALVPGVGSATAMASAPRLGAAEPQHVVPAGADSAIFPWV